ncbi:hypothetical protein DN068_06480, partial [Taibaiella soli]
MLLERCYTSQRYASRKKVDELAITLVRGDFGPVKLQCLPVRIIKKAAHAAFPFNINLSCLVLKKV